MPPILTAMQGTNAELFAGIAQVYLPTWTRVLDMTWGLGNFWAPETLARYRVISMDMNTSAQLRADLRQVPFKDGVFGGIVLDPPYAKHSGPPVKASIANPFGMARWGAPQNPREVYELYMGGVHEARRLLPKDGILILKCQDEIESGKQHWRHVALLELDGFVCEDLFILVQRGVPAMRVPYQLHARKNHSYFLVHRRV